MQKNLSICIPTFNRSGYLRTLLSNIRSQLHAYELFDRVEVLVSDNCSADDTADVAREFADIIVYRRNETNIGPDANFLQLFEMATGSYIWLPGDDDELGADTLRYILRMIDIKAPDYLYLKTAGPAIADPDRGAVRVSNVELLEKVNIFTTFMTSQVIRASLVKAEIADARKYLGGFMAYYKIFLQALWNSRVCLISEGKEVYANDDNTGGYSFYKVWSVSVFDVLTSSSFAGNARIVSLMKMRMFLTLLLPITFKLRTGVKGFHFSSERPEVSMAKYFGSSFFRSIFAVYTKGPLWLLRPLNWAMRLLSSFVKRLEGSVV